MPARSPSARDRLAERDPDVLHGVVAAGLEVAAGLDLDVDERVAREQRQHVVEEAHAGGTSAAPEPSSSTRTRTSVSPVVRRDSAARLTAGTLASAEAVCMGKPSASASTARCGVSASDRLVGHLDHGHPPQERGGAEGRRVARRAPGGQDMVGAGDVVAEGGRAVRAHEHRPRPRDLRRDRLGVARRDLEVLGGERLGQLDRQGHAGTLDERDGTDRRRAGPPAPPPPRPRPRDRRSRAPPASPRRARPGPAGRAPSPPDRRTRRR